MLYYFYYTILYNARTHKEATIALKLELIYCHYVLHLQQRCYLVWGVADLTKRSNSSLSLTLLLWHRALPQKLLFHQQHAFELSICQWRTSDNDCLPPALLLPFGKCMLCVKCLACDETRHKLTSWHGKVCWLFHTQLTSLGNSMYNALVCCNL